MIPLESNIKMIDQFIESAHQFVNNLKQIILLCIVMPHVIQISNYVVKDVTCEAHEDKLLRGIPRHFKKQGNCSLSKRLVQWYDNRYI